MCSMHRHPGGFQQPTGWSSRDPASAFASSKVMNRKASALCAGYFLWRKESNQRKHSRPIQSCRLRRSRDFSMKHPCLIEKRRTSCAPPDGSPVTRWLAVLGMWKDSSVDLRRRQDQTPFYSTDLEGLTVRLFVKDSGSNRPVPA